MNKKKHNTATTTDLAVMIAEAGYLNYDDSVPADKNKNMDYPITDSNTFAIAIAGYLDWKD